MTEPTQLAQLLCAEPSPDQPVALGDHGWLSRAEFSWRVSQWQAAVEQTPSSRVAIYFDDTYEFAAALYGLWYAGKTALLMGDCLPATVSLVADKVGAFVGDVGPAPGVPVIAKAASSSPPATRPPLDPEHLAVIVLTSGSTGTPKMVPMTLAQLESEVAMHERQWAPVVGQSLVIGTVSHQHIYGLVWRVLWPLAGRRPFVSEVCRYAEDAETRSACRSSCVLVTTPTHLARWPHRPGERAPGHWSMVVSSTAPLARKDSEFGHEYFGTPVTELFGSSETGGIAWRQQTVDDVWTTLDGIHVDREPETGALLLKSPLVAADGWFRTGDKAEVFSARRFRLLGRLDRIAKIEGKRVSLSAMEQRLAEHDGIRDVRVLVLTGKRTETAVVAVLQPAAREQLEADGKRALTRALRGWLSSQFEAPVLPRRWRFVEQLPRNAQGKIPQHYLAELFEPRPSEPVTDKPHFPEVLDQQWLSGEKVCVQLRVPKDLAFFEGHFDQLPVLPGVVQVHWAEHYARQLFGNRLADRDAFAGMESVKFHQRIEPDQTVSLELTLQPERSRLLFRLHAGETAFSTGRMVFNGVQEPV
ncbi:MAG: AMP-binding protein [Alteromonadaceae bacterium]|nr:AMP-binding protein [Alteromonadaceae bacterium]